MRLGGIHLRAGGLDLLVLSDGFERSQMFLRGQQLAVGLHVIDAGLIDLALRERALLE